MVSRRRANLRCCGRPLISNGLLDRVDALCFAAHVQLFDARVVVFDHEAARARFLPLYNGAATPQDGQAEIEQKLAALPWPAEVVVLGMGGDGHTASLFPRSPALLADLESMNGKPEMRRMVRINAGPHQGRHLDPVPSDDSRRVGDHARCRQDGTFAVLSGGLSGR